MHEHQNMAREIRWITIMIMFMVSGISLIIFQGQFATIGIGICIGALAGLIGFNMIVHMADTIEYYDNAKAKGSSNYTLRYLIYALILGLSVYKGIHILALLVGMLCHKASIMLYVFLHRKED